MRVTEPELTELTRRLSRVQLEAGSVLYASGTVPKGVWIIRHGAVEVSEGAGSTRSVVGILRKGEIAGDLYALLNNRPPFTARCIEKTECWFLSADDLRKLLAAHPSLAIAWLCNLAARLSRARGRVLVVVGGTLPQRLARLLLGEAEEGVLRAPQGTIAQMLGARRTSVNKILKGWERRGIVHLGYATVTVDDVDALRTIVGEGRGASQ
jgi:CRP-like cAMP-binding protein